MSRLRLLTFLTSAAACLLLSACATSGAPNAAPVAVYRDHIELAGRISVQYQKDGKDESMSGKFSWSQGPARVDIGLASPLDQTLATLSVTPQQATLIQAGRAPRSAADIDTLTSEVLGWPLPVSGMRDWLQGYADGADGQRFAASPAHNTVTTRDGWRLRFVSWRDAAAAVPQPKRIDCERDATAQTGAVMLHILIDEGN